MYRFFPYCLILWNINYGSTQKSNFYRVNSCTDIKLKEIPVEVFQNCSETDKTIHCLPDENDNLGLSCFALTWISKYKCPSYNSYQGNMDEKDCRRDRNGSCPDKLYKSPLSVRYSGCYVKEKLLTETSTSKITTTAVTNGSTMMTWDYPSTIGSGNGKKQRQTCKDCDDSESGNGWKPAFIVILILFLLASIAGVVFVMRSKQCRPYKESFIEAFNGIQCCRNDSKPPDTDNKKPKEDVLLENGDNNHTN